MHESLLEYESAKLANLDRGSYLAPGYVLLGVSVSERELVWMCGVRCET